MEISEIKSPRKTDLQRCASIDPSFEVDSYFDGTNGTNGLKGIALTEKRCDRYVKNYDRISCNHPVEWSTVIDTDHASLFFVCEGKRDLAAALLLYGFDQIPENTATIWDIRVEPESRRKGVAGVLLERMIQSALDGSCEILKAETQNNNVGACKFYAKRGFSLGTIKRYAYAEPELRNEIMLVWYKELL